MSYLWMNDIDVPKFSELEGSKDTDVLIIGGGMAGVLCAWKLHEAGLDYMLVEAGKIGLGITKGTTAVISAQHSTLYQELIKSFGREKAKQYLSANLDAVEQMRKLSESIQCDYEQVPSVLYSGYDKSLMEKEARAVNSLGFGAEFVKETQLPHPVAGAVVFPDMGQFHPLKFLYGAAKGLNIYENTFVKRLVGCTAITDRGNIHAKRVIITTHYPFINSHGLYFMKMYQKRSFVIAVENAVKLDCTLEDYAGSGIYMRSYGDLLLVGGGDRRTGKKSGGFETPREFIRRYYPQAREKYVWANQDCISLDGVPYIGKYGKKLPNVYVATGFNEWGMSSSMVSAQILGDMVQGIKNPYEEVFTPDRSMLNTQLLSNIGETVINFAVPTLRRCPHLGCALKWNSAEHSWDCPCHGSRFDEGGTLIDNPAMRDCHGI